MSPATSIIARTLLTGQLTAFCWNVQDGRLPEKDLVDVQKERAIRQLPSLLDFAGYVVRTLIVVFPSSTTF